MNTPANNIVHLLVAGQTPCTLSLKHGYPADWPAGHWWSAHRKDVTCTECLTMMRLESAQAVHSGSLGGIARKKALTPARRSEIAKKAANARWKK